MTGRPEILFPLFADLTSLDGVGPKTAKAFSGLEVEAPRDLLFTLPHGIVDRTRRVSVRDVTLPAVVTVEVEVVRHMPPARKGRPHVIVARDAGTTFQIVYFHPRADWLRRTFPVGARRVVSGRAELYDGIARMAHPDHVVLPDDAGSIPEAEPVYPLAAGLTQKAVHRAAEDALGRLPSLPEWIEPGVVKREGWTGWREAVIAAHRPRMPADCASEFPARRRLAYDEFLAHQLTLALARARRRMAPGRPSEGDGALRAQALAALPFPLTGAQRQAIDEIIADMAGPSRMNRLLQGDVGSGKTLVAFLAMLNAVETGGQAALMAPTEILARQHAARLGELASTLGLRLELVTGRDGSAGRAAKFADIADGAVPLVVGTHALFQDVISFADLRLAVIDEQHRFGVHERMRLGAKGDRADMLVMTATPIPRSLALTHFGDMDVSILDEKPPGRQPIRTVLVSAARMEEVVDHLRAAIAEGRRGYWVCPLVEESAATDLTAATDRHAHLQAALGDVVRLVHGQMPGPERDAAMADFADGRASLLVATTVIEVGVDVPEATIMVIERAERFGLAQLHQLRGRIGRGAGQSSCLLMYQPPLTEPARRRLETLRRTEDGFAIAEEDLAIRGAGDLLGTAQSGLPRFRVGDAERQAGLMAMAQRDARLLLDRDPDLDSERGRAARTLLWLMRQDRAIAYFRAG